METSASARSGKIRSYKAWQYYLALAVIASVLFVMLEGGLRLFHYGRNLELFIPATEGFSDHLMTNPAVSLRFFREEDDKRPISREQFLRHKPKNGYRIFMLGESTAVGWPYDENMMPSRILASRLTEAFPDKYIEVVNVGIVAVNSYTHADFADEVLAQLPDAVLIYSGHNEFYDALGAGPFQSIGNQHWLIKTYLALQRFKSFLLLRNALNAVQSKMASGSASRGADKKSPVEDRKIIHGGTVYQQGINQFRENMGALLGKFNRAGVPVFISEQVSNLRDQPPFASVPASGEESALDAYHKAQQLEQSGRFDEARASYIRAKDMDAMPVRAPEQINRVIHQLAGEYRAHVVPMQRYFESRSPNGIIGSQLIIDHLHPNAEGLFLLSEAFLDSMRQSRLISDPWPLSTTSWDYRGKWGFTEFDEALARLRVVQFTDLWPFSPLNAPGQAFALFRPRSSLEGLALQVLYGHTSLIDAHRQLAINNLQQGNVDGALREYRSITETFPYWPEIHLGTARLALNHGRLDDALALLLRVIRMQPNAEASKWIGQIYLQRKDLPQAVHYLEQARAWGNGNDTQLQGLLKEVYLQAAEHERLRGPGGMPPASSGVNMATDQHIGSQVAPQ